MQPNTAVSEDVPAALVASLSLSLDRLDDLARALLPRLGVFQSGAMEPLLLEITGIGESQWKLLCQQLEAAALIKAESLPGVNPRFLRFHPSLASLLWTKLDTGQQQVLSAAH